MEFKVVWDETGEPVPQVRLRIAGPDGIENFHTTDSSGKIRIDDLERGDCIARCKLNNPLLSNTLSFVGMGKPAGTQAKSNQTTGSQQQSQSPKRMGVQQITLVEAHKVATGENLKRLAEGASLTWQELAKFNWDTDVPKEINEHLRDDIGCTVKTPDGKNYKFDDSDHPGIVYIPTNWEANGLGTEKTHIIRVKVTSRFFVILENETGLRIPEAQYEATLADGSLHSGTLGIGGVDAIEDPPPGPVFITYPDLDDIAAKSLAACARQSFNNHDPQELYRILGHSSEMIHKVIEMYKKYYNDYTGKGLVDDIYAEITDPNALRAVVGQLACAGVKTREKISIVSWDQQEADE